MQRSGRRPARPRQPSAHPLHVANGVGHFKLSRGGELIDVVVDQRGIHFRQPGTGASGYLDWDQALGMSLVPPKLREPAA